MKILKRGKLEAERLFRASCNSCGTKVEFKRSEGKVVYDQRDGDYIQVSCPMCQTLITASL